MAKRAVTADPGSFIRIRGGDGRLGGFVTLPYDVLAGRTIAVAAPASAEIAAGTAVTGQRGRIDVTYSANSFLRWIAGLEGQPANRDAHWLTALPPRDGWQRVDLVPDTVIRALVSSGALLARDITVKGEQQSLLASTVLTVTSTVLKVTGQDRVDVPLQALTALTAMGFLPRDSHAAVDVAPGWIRVAAPLGSTFTATRSSPLGLL